MFLSLVCYSGSKLRPEHNENPTQVQMRCVVKLNTHILRERESEYPDVLVWCSYISSCWHDSRWGVWPPPDGRFTHKHTHAICLFCCHTVHAHFTHDTSFLQTCIKHEIWACVRERCKTKKIKQKSGNVTHYTHTHYSIRPWIIFYNWPFAQLILLFNNKIIKY